LEQASDSPLSLEVVMDIVATTERLKRELRREIDLEWVYDGHAVNWLQLREITSLGALHVYTNKISKEMIPGQIKPLVMSTIIPMNVRQIAGLLEALSGDRLAEPAQLIKSFHYRIYFEMNAFGRIFSKLGLPRESLEIMFGVYPAPQGRRLMQMHPRMLKHTPRWMRLVWREWQFATQFAKHFDGVRAQYKALADTSLDTLDEPQLLDLVGTLNTLHAQTTHANVTIPIFMFLLSGLLKTLLRRHQIDLERIDLGEGLDELAEYQPNVHLAMLRRQFIELDASVRAEIISGGYATLATLPAATGFKENLDAFLENFGHLGDSGNDFTVARWHESRDLILKLIAKETPADSLPGKSGRLSELLPQRRRSAVFNLVHSRARYFYLQRERASSLYSLSTGLYRRLFLALGARLRQRDRLRCADDIFYLFEPEVHALVHGTQPEQDWMALVTQRRCEMEAARDTLMPPVIFGEQLPPLNLHRAKKLSGTPTSRGHYTGTARLVRSLTDFDKLQSGDVLIIPYSDVGWTPLFARAGAVVAESGGMLSHSAIIAREYGIPAVVSVNGALQLADGSVVTVDGYKGEVFVHESLPS
jgi:pyruvate,water dikinase